MGDRKLPADIPSNYVTLLELQERWVKEQQRKQREKEEEEKGNEQKLLRRENEEKKERNTQARLLKNGQRNRRWNYRRGNQNSKKSGRHVCPEENEAEIVAAFVEGNEIESAVKETKNKGWGNNWKQKQQKKEKEKMEDGEARGKEEEESGRHVCPEENEAEIVAAFVEGNEIESAVKETKNKGWGNNWKQKQQKKEKEKMEDGEARGKEEEESGRHVCPEENEAEIVAAFVEGNEIESAVKETKNKGWGNNWKQKQQKKEKEKMEDGEARGKEEEESGRHVCPEENEAEIVAAFVEGNEIESAVKETKNKGWGNNWKQKQQKKEKEKMEDGEARGKEEEERKAGQADTPPVKSEGSVSVRRHDRRRDIRLEFRPKITSVVQKRDRTVTIEREVVNVAEGTEDTAVKITGKNENVLEKSEGTVEIEGKLRNLSVEKENERLETQNRIVNRSNSQYRGYNANSRNVECRGYNSGVKHRTGQYYGRFNGQYRGNYGKFNGQYRGNYGRFNGQYRGNYGRFSKGRQDGMVWAKKEQVADNDEGIGVDWMKKEKVADDGEGIGDQSSSNSAAL
ncbi:cilia- and flagella-associated protein 251 isoform X3 [Jatropha curcas]|uniref:cilia- and flagella-associated protein 251 isoform X3 n=1 Tax=Jatropha curcas TaxID=180498 RepID=UPI0018955577|nr:cilia- and flagella-associated protein 251 isoform X3 [Jatropha curcas]